MSIGRGFVLTVAMAAKRAASRAPGPACTCRARPGQRRSTPRVRGQRSERLGYSRSGGARGDFKVSRRSKKGLAANDQQRFATLRHEAQADAWGSLASILHLLSQRCAMLLSRHFSVVTVVIALFLGRTAFAQQTSSMNADLNPSQQNAQTKKESHPASKRWLVAGIGLAALGGSLELIGHSGDRTNKEKNAYSIAGATAAGASLVVFFTKGRAWIRPNAASVGFPRTADVQPTLSRPPFGSNVVRSSGGTN